MFKELTMGHAAEISVFVSILFVNLIVIYCINQVQQSPYMDEIFHIRQAKHYCHGNFTVVRKSRDINNIYVSGKSYLRRFNTVYIDVLTKYWERKTQEKKNYGLNIFN